MRKSKGSSETPVGTPSDKAGKLQHELGLAWPRWSHYHLSRRSVWASLVTKESSCNAGDPGSVPDLG